MKTEFSFSNIISYTFLLLLISFLIGTYLIGGDALSGKKENNKYYVWDAINKSNKDGIPLYKEVSRNTYMYSLINTYTLFLIIPIFVFVKIRENRLNKKKKIKKIENSF